MRSGGRNFELHPYAGINRIRFEGLTARKTRPLSPKAPLGWRGVCGPPWGKVNQWQHLTDVAYNIRHPHRGGP